MKSHAARPDSNHVLRSSHQGAVLSGLRLSLGVALRRPCAPFDVTPKLPKPCAGIWMTQQVRGRGQVLIERSGDVESRALKPDCWAITRPVSVAGRCRPEALAGQSNWLISPATRLVLRQLTQGSELVNRQAGFVERLEPAELLAGQQSLGIDKPDIRSKTRRAWRRTNHPAKAIVKPNPKAWSSDQACKVQHASLSLRPWMPRLAIQSH